jgi:hypothetical protein
MNYVPLIINLGNINLTRKNKTMPFKKHLFIYLFNHFFKMTKLKKKHLIQL